MAGRYSHFTREDIDKIKKLRIKRGLGLKEAAELYMSMASSPPVKAAAWSNADGRYGIAVIRDDGTPASFYACHFSPAYIEEDI